MIAEYLIAFFIAGFVIGFFVGESGAAASPPNPERRARNPRKSW